ncbi:MAG: hypothetical protein IPG45_30180 [Deltaproteobacteria bacterium]|jgi:hypothetical protein|nr:hypothetical protein [Deltaproteobacteria bacterium]
MPMYNSFQKQRARSVMVLLSAPLVAGLLWSAAVAGEEAPLPHEPGMDLSPGAPADEALEGQDCASGISIRIEFGHLCTSVCETDIECLEGWGCKVIEQGNGEPIGLCVPRRIGIESPAP